MEKQVEDMRENREGREGKSNDGKSCYGKNRNGESTGLREGHVANTAGEESSISREEHFPGEDRQYESQRFQMMDNPYQSFIDKKAREGKENFSFVPPPKTWAKPEAFENSGADPYSSDLNGSGCVNAGLDGTGCGNPDYDIAGGGNTSRDNRAYIHDGERHNISTLGEEPGASLKNPQPMNLGGFNEGSGYDSLPNPYGDSGWRSYASPEDGFSKDFSEDFSKDFLAESGGERQGENTATPPAHQPSEKKPVNKGLFVFMVIVSLMLCFMTALFVVLVQNQGKSQKENPFDFGAPYGDTQGEEENQGEENTEAEENDVEEDLAYTAYLRDDVKIELLPLSQGEEGSAEYAYEKVFPSTVFVVSALKDENGINGEASQGSGIVIHPDGYIVTNSHVINGTRNCSVMVLDNYGNIYDAVIVGYDQNTDIAVLKIDASNMKAAEFAQTKNLKVGQEIVALGNPDGVNYQNSLSKGIISALNRSLSGSSQGVKYIQTDAAINPGNSGGPLCNMEGQIIGINTSKVFKENFEGIAFAIPSDTVREVANDLIKYGEVREKVTLGIYGLRVTEDIKKKTGIPIGVLVTELIPEGSSSGSDIKAGDVITAIDGETVDSVEDIRIILSDKNPGDVITLSYLRCLKEDYSPYEAIMNREYAPSQDDPEDDSQDDYQDEEDGGSSGENSGGDKSLLEWEELETDITLKY